MFGLELLVPWNGKNCILSSGREIQVLICRKIYVKFEFIGSLYRKALYLVEGSDDELDLVSLPALLLDSLSLNSLKMFWWPV